MFSSNKVFRTAATSMGVVCLLWFLAATLIFAIPCILVQKAWILQLEGTCFNTKPALIVVQVLNSLLDFGLIALPMGVVRKLQLPVRQKTQLCLIFVLGGL